MVNLMIKLARGAKLYQLFAKCLPVHLLSKCSIRLLLTAIALQSWTISTHLSAATFSQIHETNFIQGWKVLVDTRLLENEKESTGVAFRLLTLQLKEIILVVPAPAVAQLREVTLWFSPIYAGVTPRTEYHPNATWLREHGRDPAMVKGIEFTDIKNFESESQRMPNFTLHELAHAYQDQILPGGFDNAEIKAAYEKAKGSGKYDKVQRRNAHGGYSMERAYALTNPMEYFAECTEAFFSRNDFYPFDRAELKQLDPDMERLLAKLWGVKY